MADTTVDHPATPAPSAEPAGAVTPPARRIPAGWRVIASKEVTDHILSIRFLLLLLVLGLMGVGIFYSVAGSIRDVAESATGARGVFLALFTANPNADITTAQLPSFVALIGFLGPLLGIAFGFDAISSERAEGTLPRLVSQPIHRDDVINGKFLAGLAVIAFILAAVTLLVAGVGMLRLGIVPTDDDIVRLATWYVISVVYIGFWLALATLCSVVFRRAATAALVALAAWLVLTFFGGLIADVATGYFANPEQIEWYVRRQELARLMPQTLYSEIATVVLDPSVRTLDVIGGALLDFEARAIPTALPFAQSVLLIWPQLVGLVAGMVICFALAYVAFMRQEVRA
jgi:ABC-2 type transport system permease protein